MTIAYTARAITVVAVQPRMRKRRVTTNFQMIFGFDAMRIATTLIGVEITPLSTAP